MDTPLRVDSGERIVESGEWRAENGKLSTLNSQLSTHNLRWIVLFVAVTAMLPLRGQVDICYDFESATPYARPMGWGALPNLDFHYVGISDALAHSGTKSLGNNGCTCYTIMPDEGINYGADSVWLTFWYYLHLNTDWVEAGYLTDATDSTTFHVLDTLHGWQQEWHFAAVDLRSVPTGARIAFFGHDIFSNDGTFWLDDMHLTSTPCAAWGLRVAENREDSVRLEWESAGSPTVTLTFNWSTPYNAGGNSYTFARNYYESFHADLIAQCPVSGCMPIQPHSEIYIHRYREGSCLDATDFNSTMAVPYYGTPVEPYLNIGTYTTTAPGVTGIFAGSHAVNTNPGSDGGGMMVFPRTIPPGDNATLRLGNRLGDWESASMLYTLDVDTNESDILVMKYTVAMAFGTFQGPEVAHRNDTLHPAWFRIELMDDTMGQVPGGCNQFYIDMWDTAGWDEMNNMYKRRDFTGMAFDLSAYHGQRLHLRVTATDGVVNNRWCYAYYNFECLKRYQYIDSCYSGDSVTFTMPYGFRYLWRRDGQGAVISNAQSITVPTDSALYHCELVDRFNTACSTTVSRWALPRPQRWESDTVVENQLPYTWHGIVFTAGGDTSLTLPSTTGCDTTLHLHLHVWPNQETRLVRGVCPDEWPLAWMGQTWTGPDSVTLTLTDIHGADSTVTLVALESPAYEVTDTVVICPGSAFVYMGVDYGGPAVVDTMLATEYGCDSLVHVSLVLRDSSYALHALHSLDRRQWADTVPIALCANETLYVVDSTEGSTAWQWSVSSSEFGVQSSEFSASATMTPTAGLQTPSSHTVTLVATDSGGCTDTLQWPLIVFPTPTAEFIWTPENPVDISPDVQLMNYSQPDSCSGWLWLVPDAPGSADCDSLTAFEPIYSWQGDDVLGTYDVRLIAYLTTTYDTVTNTCSDTAQHTIEVVTAWLDFPNLVTPNGDGVNDRWVVVNLLELGQYPMNELWIYNVWGNCIYHVRNISQGDQFWDPNETASPDGTYYYRFTARNRHGIVHRNGAIEVLR